MTPSRSPALYRSTYCSNRLLYFSTAVSFCARWIADQGVRGVSFDFDRIIGGQRRECADRRDRRCDDETDDADVDGNLDHGLAVRSLMISRRTLPSWMRSFTRSTRWPSVTLIVSLWVVA